MTDVTGRGGSVSEHAAVQGFWRDLRRTTQARIGLGRTGDALPTAQVLEFRAAHAAARDAVHTPLDVAELAERVGALELFAGSEAPALVRSRARDRAEYLRRPDLGRLPESEPVGADARRLSVVDESFDAAARPARLMPHVPHSGADIGIVLADGLSPLALRAHGPAMVSALIGELAPAYSIAVPVIATQARVALGDHIAAAMGVRTVLVLIGERPGLSVADSLGIYLTHLPRPGCTDADRNCVSNIHPPEGLGYAHAARVVAGLVRGARQLGRSGVDLKDTSRADSVGQGAVISIASVPD